MAVRLVGHASSCAFEPEDTPSIVHRAASMPSLRISSPHLVCTVDRIILGMHTADLGLKFFVAHSPLAPRLQERHPKMVEPVCTGTLGSRRMVVGVHADESGGAVQ